MATTRFLAVLVMALVPVLGLAEVRLGEIFYDPVGTDTGLEWIEIHNVGSESRHLGGWLLDANGPNLVLPPVDLPAGEILLVHTNATQAQAPSGLEIWFQNGTSMGNTHGFVGLWSAEQQTAENLVDYMEYGSTGHSWASQAITAGVWPADSFAPDVDEGHSLLRIGSGNGAEDWVDEDQPVPGSGTTAIGELMSPSLRLELGRPVLSWSFSGTALCFEIRGGEPNGMERLLGSVPVRDGLEPYSFTDDNWTEGDRLYHLDVRRHDGRVDRLGGPFALSGAATARPSGTRLLSAYPNPFNPGTLLSFELAQAGQASLGLHDLLGRRIRHLELGPLPAGNHILPLELDDQAGGLYFAVLSGPEGQRSVMKLILAR